MGSSPITPAYRFVMNIVGYYKSFIFEIKKISWISFKKTMSMATIVLSVVVIAMFFFLVVDYLILHFLKLLFGYAHVF
ncbi:preprotein translocase subunit SecE [Candidatus Xenohaliotis californiensis]|uniref:Preprotein translocase subunit SecE n=2 Tax=Candidatus Xenohaliotis californiensis TaxID=84677 RepID=A0ABP0ET03_9RICK|nr:preprotein translocase subunit SecE [Candidatus Xenohaliotis californiensis]